MFFRIYLCMPIEYWERKNAKFHSMPSTSEQSEFSCQDWEEEVGDSSFDNYWPDKARSYNIDDPRWDVDVASKNTKNVIAESKSNELNQNELCVEDDESVPIIRKAVGVGEQQYTPRIGLYGTTMYKYERNSHLIHHPDSHSLKCPEDVLSATPCSVSDESGTKELSTAPCSVRDESGTKELEVLAQKGTKELSTAPCSVSDESGTKELEILAQKERTETENELVEVMKIVMNKRLDKPPLSYSQDKSKQTAREPDPKRVKMRHEPFFHNGHKLTFKCSARNWDLYRCSFHRSCNCDVTSVRRYPDGRIQYNGIDKHSQHCIDYNKVKNTHMTLLSDTKPVKIINGARTNSACLPTTSAKHKEEEGDLFQVQQENFTFSQSLSSHNKKVCNGQCCKKLNADSYNQTLGINAQELTKFMVPVVNIESDKYCNSSVSTEYKVKAYKVKREKEEREEKADLERAIANSLKCNYN